MPRIITIIVTSLALVFAWAAPAQATAAPPAQVADVSFIVTGDKVPSPAELQADSSLAAAVTLPGTKGSVFWYSAYISGTHIYTVGNIRYSWSHMWTIKNSMNTVQALVTAACGALGSGPGAACAAVIYLAYNTIRTAVNNAITARKCLTMRFPMPPLVGLTAFRLTQVTCTA